MNHSHVKNVIVCHLFNAVLQNDGTRLDDISLMNGSIRDYHVSEESDIIKNKCQLLNETSPGCQNILPMNLHSACLLLKKMCRTVRSISERKIIRINIIHAVALVVVAVSR